MNGLKNLKKWMELMEKSQLALETLLFLKEIHQKNLVSSAKENWYQT